MANLPKKHGFLTPAERDYVLQASPNYPQLVGSKKMRHDFKSKLSSWLIEELSQTLEDWRLLSLYFIFIEKERQQRDMIRNSIWQIDDDTRLLTRFIKDWIPRERIGELVSWLMSDHGSSSSEPPDPVGIIQAQRDYLRRLRFANPDTSLSELEEKRLAALNAVNDLFLSIDGNHFFMNQEYDRASKAYTNTAYQVDLKDINPYDWLMKKDYTFRIETEKMPEISGVGKEVKILWAIDFPKALLFLIDSGACKNCFQMVERIRNMMVFEPSEGEGKLSRKVLIFKGYYGQFDATFIDEKFGNEWYPEWEWCGSIFLDRSISELDDIISKRGGKTSGILSVQSKMSDELGLLRRCGKDDLNRPTFTLTKKGKRLSRLLTTGKEKEQPIECILSFVNDDGIRQMIPIRGGDVGYLGINTFHPDDC
mgnify:CR=1 FL=1